MSYASMHCIRRVCRHKVKYTNSLDAVFSKLDVNSPGKKNGNITYLPCTAVPVAASLV